MGLHYWASAQSIFVLAFFYNNKFVTIRASVASVANVSNVKYLAHLPHQT